MPQGLQIGNPNVGDWDDTEIDTAKNNEKIMEIGKREQPLLMLRTRRILYRHGLIAKLLPLWSASYPPLLTDN